GFIIIKSAEEFVLKASFDDDEVNSDCSQGSSINIAAEHHEEAFMFDWQSLRKASELTSDFDEETDR
ncbi:24958_t:CDS:2, partial [Gigaspora margarita]